MQILKNIDEIKDMDKLKKILLENPNNIVYTYDINNKIQIDLLNELKDIEEDKVIIPLDINEFVGFNFSKNFDIQIAPSLIIFNNSIPEINAIGDEQIKKMFNILQFKK